jgi:Flp pilus assembly protein TadD
MLTPGLQGVPARSGASASAAEQAQEHSERGYKLASTGDLEDAVSELSLAVTLAPKNSQYIFALGVILAKQGKLEEAGDHFRQALKLDPTNLAIRQNLAATEWQLGKLVDAERNLQFILEQKPDDQDALFLLGMVLENRGQYAKASKLLANAHDQLRLHPESLAALLHCYYETSKLADAHQLEDSLLRDPSQTQAIFMGAGVAEAAGDYSFAEKMLTAIHDSYPSSSEIDYQLATLRYRTGRYSETEAMLQRLITLSGETGKYFNLLAWCLAKEGKTGDAVKAFDRAIDLDPGKTSNYVDLATVLMSAGLFEPALQAANQAIEVEPHSYAAYQVRGQTQMKQHDYIAAVASYTRAVELNNSSPEPLLDLAEAETDAGQFQKASALLERSIKRYPREAQFYYQYALLILYHSGTFDQTASQSKAAKLLETSLSLDDSTAGAHYELGNIWLNQDQPAKALAELRKAEKLNASNENTHYALSLALRKLGHQQEADDELQTLKRLKAQQEDVHR